MKSAAVKLRRSDERGKADHGWLQSRFTFSFADYHDPQHMGFRTLRVINDDHIAPGKGFGMHAHRDMEIISFVIDGALQHKDSMGNGSLIKAGRFQRMSAGTGVEHSEFNPSSDKPTHLVQIWIKPEKEGLPPSYQELDSDSATLGRGIALIAAREGRKGTLKINQDARLLFGRLAEGETAYYTLAKERGAWVQLIKGALEVNGAVLSVGDGAAIEATDQLAFKACENAEFLLFDLK
jgi:redox-sensitive bicupin YhaK (pirin superfamily)